MSTLEQTDTTISEETHCCEQNAQVDAAREKLAELLFEIDDITLQVNPAILCDYQVKIGVYQNELLKAQIAARRAKRKLALAQSLHNRQEVVQDDALEHQLDFEFAEWQAKLSEQMDEVMRAFEQRAASVALVGADAKELKRLHRLIIKRLHPDVNVGDEEESTHFLLIAQAAYEKGDVALLKSVEVATRHLGHKKAFSHTADELQAELMILATQIEAAQKQLDVLKNSYPYLLREKLASAKWVTETVQELKQQIADQCEAEKKFLQEYANLGDKQWATK